jgi:o-succinylbenzoate synthase
MRADFKKYALQFVYPMGTSRGVLRERDIFLLFLSSGSATGIGECAPLPGLSADDRPDYGAKVTQICRYISAGQDPAAFELAQWPSLRFGLETAVMSLRSADANVLFDTPFTRGAAGIAINGLVAMGDIDQMYQQACQKIAQGFTCLKFKIGALRFDDECRLIADIRSRHSEVEIRLDANGAFTAAEALEKIGALAPYQIHSIEQPIRPGQWRQLAEICQASPVAVALDEELIGIAEPVRMTEMLDQIRPAFIVLKPSLVGGFAVAERWIRAAGGLGIAYWVTSMLESNVGLNAISQWVSTLDSEIPQGLGTGRLFARNFASALQIREGLLFYDPAYRSPAIISSDSLNLV